MSPVPGALPERVRPLEEQSTRPSGERNCSSIRALSSKELT